MSHSHPDLRLYDSAARQHLLRRSPYHSSGPTTPMAIPHARVSPPPPPLPPPRHVPQGQDPGWHWGNSPGSETYNKQPYASVKPGSSLLGGAGTGAGASGSLPTREKNDPAFGDRSEQHASSRRASILSNSAKASDSDMATDIDDDRSSVRRPSMVDARLTSEQRMISSKSYDQQLLSKINGNLNTPTRANAAAGTTQDSTSSGSSTAARDGPLKPPAMPGHLYSSAQSPSHWSSAGPLSPRHLRSPSFEPTSIEHKHTRRLGSISNIAEEAYRQISYEQNLTMDGDFPMDEGNMKDLHLHDRSPGSPAARSISSRVGGTKRRAPSPDASREERPVGDSNNSLYHRRSQQFREHKNSPVQHYHAGQPGSLSTASSLSQRGSYTPSLGISVASSATSYSGDQPMSPSSSALSPRGGNPGVSMSAIDPELGPASPQQYAANGLHPGARGPLSRAAPGSSHQRHLSSQNPPQPPHPQQQYAHNSSKMSDPHHHHQQQLPPQQQHQQQRSHPIVSKLGGNFICECCPKKPKKFETEADLRNHEAEKQWTCLYCKNRFKNKNEAERHQNSLHLRKQSWSCAALAGVAAAYQDSTTAPGVNDICGYCGNEFPNPANWEERTEHLNHVHKFGECNQGKKFFRADHFRQHLKHSHAGTSGKWTSQLEVACMKEEPPQEKRAPTATMGSATGGSPSYSGPSGPQGEGHEEH